MKYLDANKYVWLINGSFVLVFVCLFYLNGLSQPEFTDILRLVTQSVGVVCFGVILFRSYVWRWKILYGWLVPFPDLHGTWEGAVQSNWIDPESNSPVAPVPIILTIKQSFTHISCVMRSSEMTSYSYLAEFWIDGNEQIKRLGYSYHSVPRVALRGRSAIHDGTVVFDIKGANQTTLKGVYWTDRCSTGEITLTFKTKKLLDEYPTKLGPHPMSIAETPPV